MEIKRLTITQRRWLLSFHIIFSIAMVGHVMIDLLLAIVANSTNAEEVLKAVYIAIHYIDYLAPISAMGTVATGLLLCIYTQWGLAKYYWIIYKDVLTIIVGAIGAIGIRDWSGKLMEVTSLEGLKAVQNPIFIMNNQKLLIGLGVNFILLLAIVVISVFKPWGLRKKYDNEI